MSAKHTQEPWKAVDTRVYFPNVAGGFDLRGCPDPEANARRIVACVNACKGINTKRLEQYSETSNFWMKADIEAWEIVRDLSEQRDELLSALEYYIDAERKEETCGGGYWSLVDDGHVARAAIAKAEGKS